MNGALGFAVPSCSVHSPIHCKVTKDDPSTKGDDGVQVKPAVERMQYIMGCGQAAVLSKTGWIPGSLAGCRCTKCCRGSSSSNPCSCSLPAKAAHSLINQIQPEPGPQQQKT